MSEGPIDPVIFRDVLGSYPTGVAIVTALGQDDAPVGMVVGSFTSVSLDPPLVGFFPGRDSQSWPLIEEAGQFCVNVLGSDQQDICKQVAAPGPDKFQGVDYAVSPDGLPIIANAVAVIECGLYSVTEAGDHWFVLGQVRKLETMREDDPMLFHRGRYGGFSEVGS